MKQREREMLAMIRRDYPDFKGRVLDIGCGRGDFLKEIGRAFPDAQCVGIDNDKGLVEEAREGVYISCFVADALEWEPADSFDILVASGILSCFENFEPPLAKWLSWLRSGGRLYIFGRFNTADIDTIVRTRNKVMNEDWKSALTSYARFTVGGWLGDRGWKHKFQRFYLYLDIPKDGNPINSYTVKCADGTRMVVNGANTVAEHYFLTIERE